MGGAREAYSLRFADGAARDELCPRRRERQAGTANLSLSIVPG
jgi:hypothetical protein